MRRILTVLTLALGALAFTAVSSAHDGKGDHHAHHKGNTLHYETTLTTTDTGTCGQQVWATDTLKRVYAVHRSENGSYRLSVLDRGTFVTSASQSPGACEQGSQHGSLVTPGIKGRVVGFIAGKVTGGTFDKDATCAAPCTRDEFIAAHFGAAAKFSCDGPTVTSCRYAYLYRSRDDALKYHHWLDAGRADKDGPLKTVDRGDIATT